MGWQNKLREKTDKDRSANGEKDWKPPTSNVQSKLVKHIQLPGEWLARETNGVNNLMWRAIVRPETEVGTVTTWTLSEAFSKKGSWLFSDWTYTGETSAVFNWSSKNTNGGQKNSNVLLVLDHLSVQPGGNVLSVPTYLIKSKELKSFSYFN